MIDAIFKYEKDSLHTYLNTLFKSNIFYYMNKPNYNFEFN